MKRIVIGSAAIAVLAGCAGLMRPSDAELNAKALDVMKASFRERGQAKLDRLNQDEVQRLCSEYVGEKNEDKEHKDHTKIEKREDKPEAKSELKDHKHEKPEIKESDEKKEVKAGNFSSRRIDVKGSNYSSTAWYSKDVPKLYMFSPEHGGMVSSEAAGSKTALEAKADDAKASPIEMPKK